MELPSDGGECKFKLGDKVFAKAPLLRTEWGSYAEYIAIDPSIVALAPTNVSMLEAAALPLVGLTVLAAVEPFASQWNEKTEGKRVLVQVCNH